MLHSQQIIERSIYTAILETLITKGLTLRPSDYLPISTDNSARFKADKEEILASKKLYIELYGSGSNLSKGSKDSNRIVISPEGFYPGDIGFEKSQNEENNGSFNIVEVPFEAIDQVINIRLISSSIDISRILHNILNTSIPQRGYIKPYIYEHRPFDGNIFLQLSNYYDEDNENHGLIEKVYQFTVKDTLLEEPLVVDSLPPMTDISLIIGNDEKVFENITIN